MSWELGKWPEPDILILFPLIDQCCPDSLFIIDRGGGDDDHDDHGDHDDDHDGDSDDHLRCVSLQVVLFNL